MTRQEQRYSGLIKRGFFLSECKAFSTFDWKNAPWFRQVQVDRAKIVRKWAKQVGADLRKVEPQDLRKSLTYQQMVRKFYLDKDPPCIKTRKHGAKLKARLSIDPYAMIRNYSDTYAKAPERNKDPYKAKWKQRKVERKKRRSAIDQKFSTAVGLTVA